MGPNRATSRPNVGWHECGIPSTSSRATTRHPEGRPSEVSGGYGAMLPSGCRAVGLRQADGMPHQRPACKVKDPTSRRAYRQERHQSPRSTNNPYPRPHQTPVLRGLPEPKMSRTALRSNSAHPERYQLRPAPPAAEDFVQRVCSERRTDAGASAQVRHPAIADLVALPVGPPQVGRFVIADPAGLVQVTLIPSRLAPGPQGSEIQSCPQSAGMAIMRVRTMGRNRAGGEATAAH